MVKNTSKSINDGKKVTNLEIEAEIKATAKVFGEEAKVKVSVPKSYQKFIGETLPVRINGVGIVIPVDSNTYEIPESFANMIREYLNNLTT